GGGNDGGGTEIGGGGGILSDIQDEVLNRLKEGDCAKKLNALLKVLEKDYNDKKTKTTGFEAAVNEFFRDGKVKTTDKGNSNLNGGVITLNTNPARWGSSSNNPGLI